jgi:hypothetical protein
MILAYVLIAYHLRPSAGLEVTPWHRESIILVFIKHVVDVFLYFLKMT